MTIRLLYSIAGREAVDNRQAVSVIGYLHQNHVPTFIDESANHCPSKRSSVCTANPCSWLVPHKVL